MKNRMFTIASIVLAVGIIMLLGTSYSLITNNLVSQEKYGFSVANFDVSFNDDTKINLSSIPMSDDDGIKNSSVYTFNIDNNSDYDINYRLDIIENSDYSMKDVIHYVYSVNDSEYSEVLTLKDDYTIKQNKVLKTNASDIYKIKMWLSDEADESYMNKSFTATILLTATQNEYKYATTVIEKLANNNQDNVIKVNNDYRYTKKDSPNYVWFNCKDGFTKGDDYCEKWRIIGSFNNKSENSREEYPSLKIISTRAFENINYNDDEDTIYEDAYINSYANGFYYENLNSEAQKLILNAKWYIGDVKSNDYENALSEEKSAIYYTYIALPNVSDYLYLKNESFILDNNTLLLNKTNNYVNVLNNGIKKENSQNNYNFVPCLYLRGDVSIISGDGNINNPYELGIKYPMNY